ATVERAAHAVDTRPELLIVIGLTPPCPNPPGWIEPGAPIAGLGRFAVSAVQRFLPRPSFPETVALETHGGLVNTGVVVAHAETLLALGRRRLPDVLETLEPL